MNWYVYVILVLYTLSNHVIKMGYRGSDKEWVNHCFNACAGSLYGAAILLGVTYKEINVYLFCIVLPVVLAGLTGMCLYQRMVIRRLRRSRIRTQKATQE